MVLTFVTVPDRAVEMRTILGDSGLKFTSPSLDYPEVNFEVKDADEAQELQQNLADNIFGARIPGQFITRD